MLLYFVFLLLGKLILGGAFRLAFAVSGAKKHLRVIGMVIGAVDALLLSFFFLLPLYSTVNSVATVAKDFSEELVQNGFLEEISKSEGVSLEKDVSKVTDSVLNCPPVWLASKVPFNFCTGYFGAFNMEGTRYNAFEVIDHSAVVIADGMKIATLEADTYKGRTVNLSGRSESLWQMKSISADWLRISAGTVNRRLRRTARVRRI